MGDTIRRLGLRECNITRGNSVAFAGVDVVAFLSAMLIGNVYVTQSRIATCHI